MGKVSFSIQTLDEIQRLVRPGTDTRIAFITLAHLLPAPPSGKCFNQHPGFTENPKFDAYELKRHYHVRQQLAEAGYIRCLNPNGHHIDPYGQLTAHSHRFVPTYRLLELDLLGKRATSLRNATHRVWEHRSPAVHAVFTPHPDSPVQVPPQVVAKWQTADVGLALDFAAALTAINESGFSPEKQWKCLRALRRTAGLPCSDNPVVSLTVGEWYQGKTGRVYARQLALFGLPKIVRRAALRSASDGTAAFELDIVATEPSVALSLVGHLDFPDDPYDDMVPWVQNRLGASGMAVNRALTKSVLNAMLHGQTKHSMHGAPGSLGAQALAALPVRRAIYDALGAFLFEVYHLSFNELLAQRDALQPVTAEIFFGALAMTYEAMPSAPIGLPIHDGWVSAGPVALQDCFAQFVREVSLKRLGRALTVKPTKPAHRAVHGLVHHAAAVTFCAA